MVDPSRLMFDSVPQTMNVIDQMDELRQSLIRLEDRIRQLHQKQNGVLSQTIVNPESKEDLEIAIDEIKQHVRSLRPRIRYVPC